MGTTDLEDFLFLFPSGLVTCLNFVDLLVGKMFYVSAPVLSLACFHHNFIFDEKDVISYFIIPGIINVNDGVCLSVPYPRQFNLVEFQVLKLFKSNLYDATGR